MKVLILNLMLSIPVVLNAQYNTDSKRAEFIREITKKYTRAAHEILQSDAENAFVVYTNNAETPRDLIASYGTVVHETCHGYNSEIGWKTSFNHNGYFITEDIRVSALKESFFPSSRLNAVVPKNLQEKIFRYKTYVSGQDENTATLEGVYGFLDEFSAYYNGTRADLEMLPFWETLCPYQDAKCWTEGYLGAMQSTLYAYYEFRLFIAWYLIYAEKNERKVFNELMANQNLRVAYTLLDGLFKKLVEDYFTVRNQVVGKLRKAGNNIQINAEFINIVSSDGSSTGMGIPDEDIEFLKGLFTAKEFSMLKKFSIEEVTLQNYSQFLVAK